MSWENILKQAQMNAQGWPPELIMFYNAEKKLFAIPSKNDISMYRGAGWKEFKTSFVSIGSKEGTAEYSYPEGTRIVNKKDAIAQVSDTGPMGFYDTTGMQ